MKWWANRLDYEITSNLMDRIVHTRHVQAQGNKLPEVNEISLEWDLEFSQRDKSGLINYD